MVTNEMKDIVWSTEYTPFGKVTMEKGLFDKAIKFTGKDIDRDTGLYYYNARWYDAETGRFISEDPVKDGSNYYSYVNNNPLMFIDPDGQIPVSTLLIKAASGGATDLLAQIAFNYCFNPEVETISNALSRVNKLQVGRSILEGANPFKIPGGKWGKYAVTAGLDVAVNAATAKSSEKEYTVKQGLADFMVGYIGDASGEKLSELISKYGPKAIKHGLKKLDLDDEVINKITRKLNIEDVVVETSVKVTNKTDDVYAGVKEASEYLQSQGVPREYRKQIFESFNIETITMDVADDATYGIRFYDNVNARAKGRYLFETFTNETNRYNFALPYEWNSITGIQQWKVRPGSLIIKGIAAPQFDMGSQYVGGAKQWYINNLDDLLVP